jgi:hypothetical protein
MSKIFLTNEATGTSQEQLPSGSVNFIQQGIAESIDYIVYSLFQNIGTVSSFSTASAYNVFGINGTFQGPGGYNFTQGAVLFNGELLYSPAAFVTTFGNPIVKFYANINDYYDPTLDPIQFSDNTFHYCNRYRTVTISKDNPTVPSGQYLFLGTGPTFSDGNMYKLQSISTQIASVTASLQTQIDNQAFGAWIQVGSGGGAPSYTANWTNDGSVYGNLRFTKNGAGTIVYISGAVRATGSVSATIFTLPVGYRPAIDMRFPVTVYDGSSTTAPDYIQILTSGVVQYINAVSSGLIIYTSFQFLTQ